MHHSEHGEVVFNLRIRPAVSGQGWSALIEGPDPDTRIRFQDLQALIRYLKALSDLKPARGLR